MSKYKVTGFARLLVFMICFAPIAYLAASYANGEDGIGKLKSILQIDQTPAQSIESKEEKIGSYKLKIEELEEEIQHLKLDSQ